MNTEVMKTRFRPSDYVGKKIDISRLSKYKYRFYPVGDQMLPMVKIPVSNGYDYNYGRPSHVVLKISFVDEYRIYSIEKMYYVVFEKDRWDGGWYCDDLSEEVKRKSVEILDDITVGSRRSMQKYLLTSIKCQQILTDMFVKYPTAISDETYGSLIKAGLNHLRVSYPKTAHCCEPIADCSFDNDTKRITHIDCTIKETEHKGKISCYELIYMARQIYSWSKPLIPI